MYAMLDRVIVMVQACPFPFIITYFLYLSYIQIDTQDDALCGSLHVCITQVHLQHWLTDKRARDQFLIQCSVDLEIYWNMGAGHLKPELFDHRTVSFRQSKGETSHLPIPLACKFRTLAISLHPLCLFAIYTYIVSSSKPFDAL